MAEDPEQLEKDAREQLEKLHELIESNPAEMRALMKALFPEGLSFEGLEDAHGRGVRLEGIAEENSPRIVIR